MKHTTHLRQRMSQRGVTGDMVELVLRYGRTELEKHVLGRKDALYALESIRRDERTLMKVLDKGGVTVVAEGNAILTTYNCEQRSGR